MTEKRFWELLWDIQWFMWLSMWNIVYKIEKLPQTDEKFAVAVVDKVLYDYFNASIKFDKSLLKEDDDYIIHNIFHEFSHIYTLNTLTEFEDNKEYFAHYIWEQAFIDLKNKYVFINEQQTELLARRFKELYYQTKKSL